MNIERKTYNYKLLGLLILCLCFTSPIVNAQEQYLEITNLKTNKTKKIKEKKKITVFTKNLKIKGPLKILDNETILIKETEIKISDIIMIRNKSILVKLLSAVIIPLATMAAIASTIFTTDSNASGSAALVGISALALSTQIKKKYKSRSYQFKIVYD